MEWVLAVLGIGALVWAVRRVVPGRTQRDDTAETVATTGLLFWASSSSTDLYPSEGGGFGGGNSGISSGGDIGVGGGD